MNRTTFRNDSPPVASRYRLHAYLLVELMGYIGMLAVATLIGTELFRATLRIWRDVPGQQAREASLDGALRRLRMDVWNATSIDLTNDHEFKVVTPDGSAVRWEWSSKSSGLMRSESTEAAATAWTNLGGSITFATRGPLLAVGVRDGAGDAPQEVVLASQIGILMEGRPQ